MRHRSWERELFGMNGLHMIHTIPSDLTAKTLHPPYRTFAKFEQREISHECEQLGSSFAGWNTTELA